MVPELSKRQSAEELLMDKESEKELRFFEKVRRLASGSDEKDRGLASVPRRPMLVLETIDGGEEGYLKKLYKPGEVDERMKALQMWLDSGFELGNHTYSHMSLNQNELKDWEDDVVQGESVLRILLAPVFATTFILHGDAARIVSFMIFCIAGASDVLDGLAAALSLWQSDGDGRPVRREGDDLTQSFPLPP